MFRKLNGKTNDQIYNREIKNIIKTSAGHMQFLFLDMKNKIYTYLIPNNFPKSKIHNVHSLNR